MIWLQTSMLFFLVILSFSHLKFTPRFFDLVFILISCKNEGEDNSSNVPEKQLSVGLVDRRNF